MVWNLFRQRNTIALDIFHQHLATSFELLAGDASDNFAWLHYMRMGQRSRLAI